MFKSKLKSVSESEGSGYLLADRVERSLREEIRRMRSAGEAMLPRQEELVDRYGVSLRSVREAIERLKKAKLIRSIRGKGMFVVDAPRKLSDILIVSDTVSFPYQIQCVGAITEALKGKGYTTSLVVSHDPGADWAQVVGDHPAACGVVLISRYSRAVVEKMVVQSPVPIVTISDLDEPVRSPGVCDAALPDDEALGYRGAEYLIRRGHRKIALLGWELNKAAGSEFLQGYRNALANSGLEFNPSFVMDLPTVPMGPDRGPLAPAVQVEAVRGYYDRWVRDGNLPTGLLHCSAGESQIRDLVEHCMNNHFGPGDVVACLYKEQLRAGYGGLGEATALCISVERVARQGLELLFRERKPNTPPVRYLVEEVYLYRRKDGVWREENQE